MDKKWIKLWYSILSDPQLAMLKPEERWAWMCIILISSKGVVEGTLDSEMDIKYLADESHLRTKLISESMKKMKKKLSFLPDGSVKILSYEKYQSDWSRLKKYESQKKDIQKPYKEPTNNLHSDKEEEVDVEVDLKEKREKKPPDRSAPVLQLQDYFYEKLKSKFKNPDFKYPIAGKIFKLLLKTQTIEEIKLAIDSFFNTKEEFYIKKGYDIKDFSSQYNAFKKKKGGKYDAAMERSRNRSLEKRHT